MKRRALLPLFLLLLGGCGQPEDVARYAAIVDQATAQFPEVAHSIVANCEYRAQLDNKTPEKIFSDTPVANPACATQAKAEKAMLEAHAIIEAYLNALKRLSADGLVLRNPLNTALGAAQAELGLNAAQSEALGGLAGAISRAFTDGYRRKHLARMITSANEPLQAVVAAFDTTVGRKLDREFDITEESLKDYYARGLRDAKDPILRAMWIRQGEADLAKLRARRAAVAGYVSILRQIGAGHAQLNAASGNWKSVALARFLFESARSIQQENAKLVKAFN
jgi:hypothetical protein